MYHRLLSWLMVGAFVAVSALRAQAPASTSPASDPPPGLVLVAQVRGTVTKTVNGQVTTLKINDSVEQTAKVITARDSSVVLVFSNGATTQLGDDTEMVLEQFLQDPFGKEMEQLKVAELQEEPSRSKTRLNLHRGELVGKVAKLRHDLHSEFIVQTPVGAAGIRGTTFRIVFRPQGTGQAFFQLSTVEGNVNFNQGAQTPGGGGPGAGAAAAPGQGQPQDPGTAPGGQGAAQPPGGTPTAAPAGGVAVVGGQEVNIQVSVNVSTTGQMVVATPPPAITATVPISATAQNQIVQQAQNIAVAVATTVFVAPPAPTPGAPAAGGSPAGGGTETPSQSPSGSVTSTPGAGGQTTPSGTTTATPGTSATKGTAGTAGQSGTTPATPPTVASTPPPPVTPPPKLTPGDGRPGN